MLKDIDSNKVLFIVPAEQLERLFKEMESNIIASFTRQIDAKISSDDDDVMDVKTAANFLGVGIQTVHNHKKDGKLPFHRSPSGKPYFLKSELLAIIKRG